MGDSAFNDPGRQINGGAEKLKRASIQELKIAYSKYKSPQEAIEE
jgi:hypothetical protein